MFAFQLALRTLAEGGAAGGGLSPASTLATFEQVWLMLNTALADGHGSMSDIFLFVSKNMVAVEAAGDKDKGKGEGVRAAQGRRQEACLAAEAAVLSARPRVGQEVEEGEKILAQDGTPRRHVLVRVRVLVRVFRVRVRPLP